MAVRRWYTNTHTRRNRKLHVNSQWKSQTESRYWRAGRRGWFQSSSSEKASLRRTHLSWEQKTTRADFAEPFRQKGPPTKEHPRQEWTYVVVKQQKQGVCGWNLINKGKGGLKSPQPDKQGPNHAKDCVRLKICGTKGGDYGQINWGINWVSPWGTAQSLSNVKAWCKFLRGWYSSQGFPNINIWPWHSFFIRELLRRLFQEKCSRVHWPKEGVDCLPLSGLIQSATCFCTKNSSYIFK